MLAAAVRDSTWLRALAACATLVWPLQVLVRLLGDSVREPWPVFAVAAVLGLLAWFWRNPAVSVLALLAGARLAGMGLMILTFGGRRQGWMAVLASVSGFALCIVACRNLGAFSALPSRWARAGWLAFAALVPVAIVQTFGQFGPGRFRFTPLIPVALGVAVSATGRLDFRPIAGWSWAIAGLLMAATIPAAASRYSEWRRDEARNERQLAISALPAMPTNAPYPKLAFHRGVCFTAESGVAYGSLESRRMLERLPEFGVDSIALVPYFGIRVNPLRIRAPGEGSWESEEGMELLARMAHQRGMKVMLKPHGWRVPGKEADTPEFRREWFKQYGELVEHYAQFAARIHADLFAIGTEMGWLASYDSEWREMIRRVREIYPGPLTYAATQGPEFEGIAFWDALDYIGLDNYYPLGADYSTADMMRRIEAVRTRFGKPVLFTEAGYSAVEGARLAPWEDETDKPLSLEEQARCYRALLSAFHGKEWFAGVYWWKVGTNGYGGPANNSMTPWLKPAMNVVREFFAKERALPR